MSFWQSAREFLEPIIAGSRGLRPLAGRGAEPHRTEIREFERAKPSQIPQTQSYFLSSSFCAAAYSLTEGSSASCLSM